MSHYFESPSTPERRRRIDVTLFGYPMTVETADGVFSRAGLDKATAVLLDHAEPAPASRDFLDLGCGWGPIALGLARLVPDGHVTAVDVNERALALTADNAAASGVAERVRTAQPDNVAPDVTFDEIWSNPPIRVGKEALHELLLTWLPRLRPGGSAWLVVGKNLGADSLQSWLEHQGYPTARVASKKGFRVLRVRSQQN